MFTVEDIMELLNCGKQKAVRCLVELDSEKGIGLVEKKRLGLGRPNVLYVKNFMQKGSADQNPGRSLEDESGQESVHMMEDESGWEPERGMDSIEDVDEFVELMVEVMAMPDGSSLRVAGVERPVSVVKSRFMKINEGHIEYVMGCLQNNTTKIGNIKAYLLTALYNATLTISSYYRAEVNHDMYGGGC